MLSFAHNYLVVYKNSIRNIMILHLFAYKFINIRYERLSFHFVKWSPNTIGPTRPVSDTISVVLNSPSRGIGFPIVSPVGLTRLK